MKQNEKFKWWLLWHKKRFDTGLGLTNYLKYFIAFFALASKNTTNTIIISIGYAVLCYIVGYFYIDKKWIDTEKEIDNILNPFQREIRRKLNGKLSKRRRL